MPGHFARILVIFGWVGVAMAGQPHPLADSLGAIRAIRPEGVATPRPRPHARKLAEGDASTLVPLLGAMEGANDLSLILSTPSISRGAIYFRSHGRLWKIGKPAA